MNFESCNPATGELLAVHPEHDKAETDARLQRAWNGWRHWSRTPLHKRIAFLAGLAELLEERAETYGRLITAEMGKPLADSIFEIKKSASDARHLAEAGEAYLKPQPLPGLPAQIIYESVGPIFSVQPWNVPFWQALRFFNTTALVGNTALIKQAETVQGCAEALETLVRDAGSPEGLYVNPAIQVEACAAVIADPRARAATVTGSVSAGRAVAEEAARVGKRVVLELGGSDPFIVLEDADLLKAVQFGVASRFFNNSEGCICAKRFLVAEPLFDDFTKAFVEQSRALPMGDPMQESIKLGPLARPELRRDLHLQVLEAVKAGARILTGGEIPAGPGNFYPATVLVGLPPEAAFGTRRETMWRTLERAASALVPTLGAFEIHGSGCHDPEALRGMHQIEHCEDERAFKRRPRPRRDRVETLGAPRVGGNAVILRARTRGLALTDAVTRITAGHVPGAVFERARTYFNAWNRLPITMRTELPLSTSVRPYDEIQMQKPTEVNCLRQQGSATSGLPTTIQEWAV